MYDNEFETKENKIETKDKIEPQHIQYKPDFPSPQFFKTSHDVNQLTNGKCYAVHY